MRGKLTKVKQGIVEQRITPAHAGKTWHLWMKTAATEDHPRACGENVFARHSGISGVGSPPRMRGKPSTSMTKVKQGRITPAHAGKTSFFGCRVVESEDHPRACGENDGGMWIKPASPGSPPRMRGKRCLPLQPARTQQDHPRACGENRCRQGRPGISGRDHPRACGENDDINNRKDYILGSPPRMRGKRSSMAMKGCR